MSGLIDEQEAKGRRHKIQKEADFYGAMDGATKISKASEMFMVIIRIMMESPMLTTSRMSSSCVGRGIIKNSNIVVGVVVFLIIVLVQFIVITKGAERVAEVAARFTLDAMPGKQMAIERCRR